MLLISYLFAVTLLSPTDDGAAGDHPPATSTVDQREKALNTVFSDYWEQQLKDSPEFASTLGDKRYDDQLSDYSVAAYNAHLERDRTHSLTGWARSTRSGFREQGRSWQTKSCWCATWSTNRRRHVSSRGRCR